MNISSNTILFSNENGNAPIFSIFMQDARKITGEQMVSAVKMFYDNLYISSEVSVELKSDCVRIEIIDTKQLFLITWTFLRTIEL